MTYDGSPVNETSPDWTCEQAFCIVSRGDAILVIPHENGATGDRYYRPPGGELAPGEGPREALVREFRELFGATLTDLERIATLENAVDFGGDRGRETVAVYDGRLEGGSAEGGRLTGRRRIDGEEFEAVWKPVDEFGAGAGLLPGGLLGALTERGFGRDADRD